MCGGSQGLQGSSSFPNYGTGTPMQKSSAGPTDYSSLGGSLGNVASGGATGTPAYNPVPYTANIHEPIIDRSNTPVGPDGQPYGYSSWPSPFGSQGGGMQTGGPMTASAPPPPQMPSMPPPQAPQPTQQPPMNPAMQAYMSQNYMPGIHGGPDPSMLAASFNQQPQQPDPSMNKVGTPSVQPNPFARTTGAPPGTTNGPGGLGFATPGQPTQLFGPTAGLFGGATPPPGTPNNFGYYPGTQQWGAPNMGWASQWGKQPGT